MSAKNLDADFDKLFDDLGEEEIYQIELTEKLYLSQLTFERPQAAKDSSTQYAKLSRASSFEGP